MVRIRVEQLVKVRDFAAVNPLEHALKTSRIPLWQVLDVLVDLLRAQLLVKDDPIGCIDGSQDAVIAEEQDSIGRLGDIVDDVGDILIAL